MGLSVPNPRLLQGISEGCVPQQVRAVRKAIDF